MISFCVTSPLELLMRRLLSILVLIAYLSAVGCASSGRPAPSTEPDTRNAVEKWNNEPQKTAPVVTAGPCADSLYIALKSKPLDEMSNREFAYFYDMDRLCTQSARYNQNAAQLAESMHRQHNMQVFGIVAAFVLTGILLATTYDHY